MSDIGTYSFLPWLRRGIANRIGAGPPGGERATVSVTLRVTGARVGGGPDLTQDIVRDVELYGPGDITKVEERAIVRVEPRHWIANFEPNYLPFIEFYDEDYPWRYTPVAPDGTTRRLLPWLALVVLEEGEFEDVGTDADAPAASINVTDMSALPPADQLWAWAHVHVNRSLASAAGEVVNTDMGAVLPRLEAVLSANPDLASSRILCPRRLAENAAYHAFLVPAFESGRLAGLGLDDVAAAPSQTHSAWGAYPGRPAASQLCYYHRWFFRTAMVGDFEYLVRLLEARPVDPHVGQRDMDVLRPGSDLPPIADPALRGVLRLGGALRVPAVNLDADATAEAARYESWDTPFPHPFQTALAELVNLAEDYVDGDATDPDPLVTPPLYGRWHALTLRLLEASPPPPATHDNWVHELNLDPRFRVPAGFGTKVVQTRQEDYMAAAWNQIGEVLEANRRIRLGQLATGVARRWHERHFAPHLTAEPGRLLALTAPVQPRLLSEGVTVSHTLAGSMVGRAPLSAPMRRAVRPGSRLVRALPFTAAASPTSLVTRLALGEVAAAPPKGPPPGAVTLDEIVEELRPDAPRPILDALERFPWLRFLPLVVAAVLLLVALLVGAAALLVVAVVLALLLVFLWRLLERWYRDDARANVIDEDRQTPAAVDSLPKSPDFVLSEPGSGVRPSRGSVDSVEAQRFKDALREANAIVQASRAVASRPPRRTVDVAALASASLDQLRPDRTIPHRVLLGMHIPVRISDVVVERFVEAMAYPEIDVPMYGPLNDLSAEHFVPNLNLIPENSITLLETNQRFIEAYMVGLNHEFARELLWREYPTDQRGSYFRQFWDVSSQLPRAGEDPEAVKERLRDIPPLHRWSLASHLGEHDNRELAPGTAEEEVVLVIRGELLKKYPTAVIYAQRAEWVRRPDGSIDPNSERRLVALTTAEEQDPPREKMRTPLYRARVEPDIYFFGFDLTAEAAKGGTGDDPGDDPGWFFVIRERPGDPRFGFDIDRSGPLNVWNDLAWSDVLLAGQEFVAVGANAPARHLTAPTSPELVEKKPQYEEDKALAWGPNMNASDVAYIAYQAPVLVAVHAQEMLRGA